MRKTSVLAGIALSTLVGAMVACNDDNDEYTADMSAAAEIPTPVGSPTATGRATMELDDDVLNVVIQISGQLTSGVTMAHIHAPASTTQTADIVLDFVPSMTSVINAGVRTGTILSASFDLSALPVSATGVLRIDRATLINFLNTGQAYVNVHTVDNPSGEIRGQIRRDD